MFGRAAIALLALCCAAPSLAATVSDQPDKVVVTIYNIEGRSAADFSSSDYGADEGLAFIAETRTIDLPAGPAEIEFRGVVSTMVPQTADIEGLPNGVLERNFDYDLLSPGSLLAKSIDKTVRLVRADPATGKLSEKTAIVRSAPNGVMLEIDGKYEALRCSGLPEKLVFGKTPEGLRDTPTLVVRTNALKAGRYTIRLSYLATGLVWSADYIARIRPDGRTLDLTGWLTLANFSATSFKQTATDVVAGTLETTGEDQPVAARPPALLTACWPTDINWATHNRLGGLDKLAARYSTSPVTAVAQQEMNAETVVVTGSRIPAQDLGDYKLFALPEPTTVAARQIKQVQFLDQQAVPFTRIYGYVTDPYSSENDDDPPFTILRLKNTQEAGLGKPLPRGEATVVDTAPDGSPLLAGQSRVKDIPVGLPMEFTPSSAMNIAVARRVVDTQTIGEGKDKIVRNAIEITIENDKPIPIQFELSSSVEGGGRVTAENLPHIAVKGGVEWDFPLAPGQKEVVEFTVETPR